MEKTVSFYKTDLVASLSSFHCVQSSLAVREFRAAGEERCKRGHGRVCANLSPLMPDVASPKVLFEPSGATLEFTTREWWAVTQKTLKNTKLSNLGVGAYAGMGACSGQYDKA